MDVGCYPASMVQMVNRPKYGTDSRLTSVATKTDEGVDLYSSAQISFVDGTGAHIATGVGQQLDNTVGIFGSKGSIYVPRPWQCPPNWEITLQKGGQEEIIRGAAQSAYVYQIDEVGRCLEQGLDESPTMPLLDSLQIAEILDVWRDTAEIVFPQEHPQNLAPTIHGSANS